VERVALCRTAKRRPPVLIHASCRCLVDRCLKDGGARNSVAALLTMGCDGADGLLRLKENGAHPIAQSDSHLCRVGNASQAYKSGCIATLDLEDIRCAESPNRAASRDEFSKSSS